ncbi:hypothetical protein HMPREF9371_0300 [Neisseria shayeganii 871]|uniref:Uncharacterized protein n=1 Tax=Neisseria shayeganii 871 TaxID=1032488 RepID=G4CFB1_9NEIS|nr:hypothetical protein HMPREF9371_0300 [Neisseria shayeganii 871]
MGYLKGENRCGRLPGASGLGRYSELDIGDDGSRSPFCCVAAFSGSTNRFFRLR